MQPVSDERSWRAWLIAFLATTLLLGSLGYAAVVLIDPFATGRFTPVQRIDFASDNPRLAKAGLVRDQRYDAAIFGSSTGYPLDPKPIGDASGWRIAQLAIPATLPPNQLRVARAFERVRRGRANLQIYVLDRLWCRHGDPNSGAWGAFPEWLYETSDSEYLSRILFPASVATAAQRVIIWLGLAQANAREDGFMISKTVPIPRAQLLALGRPQSDEAPGQGFPALDQLATHITALPADVRVAIVFAPPYVGTLPVAGSPADARLQACKARSREIVGARQHSAWLDLMTENDITRNQEYFFDEAHYTPAAAAKVADAIVNLLEETKLARR